MVCISLQNETMSIDEEVKEKTINFKYEYFYCSGVDPSWTFVRLFVCMICWHVNANCALAHTRGGLRGDVPPQKLENLVFLQL